jgi:hypothetical protein
LAKPLVRPALVEVALVLAQQGRKALVVDKQHVVEQLAACAAHKALSHGIHVRRPNRRSDHLGANALRHAVEPRLELVVVIPQQHGRRIPARRQLRPQPLHASQEPEGTISADDMASAANSRPPRTALRRRRLERRGGDLFLAHADRDCNQLLTIHRRNTIECVDDVLVTAELALDYWAAGATSRRHATALTTRAS